ncbi:MAG: hypothetical protein ACRDDZ_00940 [Marinifilaceae bacterium]
MHTIYYQTVQFWSEDFNSTISEFIANADFERVVRVVFFANVADNDQYMAYKNGIAACFSAMDIPTPTWSLVAQKPLDCDITVEMHICDDGVITHKNEYIVIDSSHAKEIIVSGICGSIRDSILSQCTCSFVKLEQILKAEGMRTNHIVRQWNYIERITAMQDEHQHYQDFNDIRTLFYDKVEWNNGYPAATGIGMQHGGIIIDINAVLPKDDVLTITPINNEKQIAAHQYSDGVLLGESAKKTTPKFERAKSVTTSETGTLYISGTAAIRGEESILDMDITTQSRITMENIEYLVSEEKLKSESIACCEKQYMLLRAYIKEEKDMEGAKAYLSEYYPEIPTIYLLADVCRDELLIEVEGVVYLCNDTNKQ